MIRRAVIIATVLAFALVGTSAAESLGDKLAAKGYTRTLFVAQPNAPGTFSCQWGRCIVGNFDPNAPYVGTLASGQARWGVDQSSATIKGNTVGERLGDLSCAAQTLGLPAGYVVTLQDIADARVVTRLGQQSAAWDAELSAMTCGVEPPPAGCVAPKVCMTPPKPCETCEVCPTCPPAPPACAPMPPSVRATIGKAPGWDGIMTPNRKRVLAAVKAWAESCP